MEDCLARSDGGGSPGHSQCSLEDGRRIYLMGLNMLLRNLYVLRVVASLAGSGALLPAADFVAPAEGPVAFRRDQISLDVDTMARLSKTLGTLAQGLDAGTPAERRGAAQMLALATALDPSNAAARGLINDFELGNHQPAGNPAEIAKSQAKIWQYIGWLETPEAGGQGQALAACLADIIVISDPKHPRAEDLRAAGERGAWGGWVPALAAFETKPMTAVEEPQATELKESPEQSGQITLAEAQVFSTLWEKSTKTDAPRWVLAGGPLRMSVRKVIDEEGMPDEFSITIRSRGEGILAEPFTQMLGKLLQKQHGPLPAGRMITISSENVRQSIPLNASSAAMAVLGSAAITGLEPDATILGQVDENGAFKLSPGFWDQLSALAGGNGGRLILPAAASEYLLAILALERPQFFLDYEVLLASDFGELLELAAKAPNEAIGGATAKFQEIRAKAGGQPVGQYVANPFIRRRLADLGQEAPYHFSARMLAIQGAGSRPTEIPQSVLVAELLRAIAPMAWIVKGVDGEDDEETQKLDRFSETYETCRLQVEALDRYVRKEDRELHARVKSMVVLIRPIDRAVRARGENYLIREAVFDARSIFVKAHAAVVKELAAVAGAPMWLPDD